MSSAPYPTGRFLADVSRPFAFVVVVLCYVIAFVTAWATVAALRGRHPMTIALVADVVATVIVFASSTVLANASLYDPYWSVAPPLVAAFWLAESAEVSGAAHVRQVAVVALVVVWAMRLTGNWCLTWRGLRQEDWRYVHLRETTTGRVPWWLVNLGGIQLLPTLVVFGGLLSLWPALGAPTHGIRGLDVLAFVVTAGAITVEAVADLQLRRFAADPANRGRTIDVGLWTRSRHPNYLGEIGFWWGLWLFGLAADPSWWWTIVGPLAMVALFEGVSIPMMEERSLQRRPSYAACQRSVPRLVPLPRRRD